MLRGNELAQAAQSIGGSIREIPVEDQLKQRRKWAAEQLEDIDNAIKALESNPQLLETLNLLRKVGI